MPGEHAPVALFAYRRPDHLGRTVASLRECDLAGSTDVTVFLDGARGGADAPLVAEVRQMAGRIEGFASVTLVERPVNVGLAGNVIAGVGQLVREHGRVIVLEDDMVVSRDFLTYMNTGLDLYAAEPRVASIHGYVYPTIERLPAYFFLRGADCWGWATWQRAWAHFESDGASLLRRLEAADATDEFDFGGAFGYTQMLREQVAGHVDSWAVRWYASAFLDGMLTLYPGRSLVENIGLDGSGTHSLGGRGLATSAEGMRPLAPIPVEEDRWARAAIARALRAQRPVREDLWTRLRTWVWPRGART